jgi:hypothetical protein
MSIAGAQVAHSDTITFNAVADTTLLEASPDNNNGGQSFVNAGTTQNYGHNRGLFRFDLSSIPAGATITGGSLTLQVVQQPRDGYNPATFGVFRMLTSWGEGNQVADDPASPGLGAPAAAGEATWNSRFALTPGGAWAAPGGAAGIDFVGVASSTVNVYGTGESPYIFSGEGTLLEDLQYWVQHPNANFGWMLMPLNAEDNFTARRFASHEDQDFGPQLVIDFTPVPEPSVYTLAGLGLGALLIWRRRTRSVQ